MLAVRGRGASSGPGGSGRPVRQRSRRPGNMVCARDLELAVLYGLNTRVPAVRRVHEDCVMWSPEFFMKDDEPQNIDKIVNRGKSLVCAPWAC